jgi:hypothetical protein
MAPTGIGWVTRLVLSVGRMRRNVFAVKCAVMHFLSVIASRATVDRAASRVRLTEG